MVHKPWREEDRWEKTGLRAAGGRQPAEGGFTVIHCDFSAVRECRTCGGGTAAVPTCGLEPLDGARRAEVEAPQVEEEEQEGDDGDEDERDDGGGHGHHADVLEK